jgi:Restriction endonuclease fold toxin 5
MAGLLLTGLEAAVAELGPALARAGAALLGGAATAGTASLSGDTAKEDSKAAPIARTLPRTGESCKKCPPESGAKIRQNHGVNWKSYRYQARITGFTFDAEECRWSDEWKWLAIDFDGFQPGDCLLQETKVDYDQFLDDDAEPLFWYRGFKGVRDQLNRQAVIVNTNPPARLMWYFMTPHARQYLLPDLRRARISSVYQP